MSLLDASVRATFVAVLVALALLALRVRGSALRHAAWTAVLGAMMTMPVESDRDRAGTLGSTSGVRLPKGGRRES